MPGVCCGWSGAAPWNGTLCGRKHSISALPGEVVATLSTWNAARMTEELKFPFYLICFFSLIFTVFFPLTFSPRVLPSPQQITTLLFVSMSPFSLPSFSIPSPPPTQRCNSHTWLVATYRIGQWQYDVWYGLPLVTVYYMK